LPSVDHNGKRSGIANRQVIFCDLRLSKTEGKMKNIVKYLSVGAVFVAVSCVGVAASASTIVTALSGSPFSTSNPVSAIPTGNLFDGNTHDFTFSWADAETQVELKTDNGGSRALQYQLYSGAPGSGVFLGQSTVAPDPLIDFNALRGDYYIEVTADQVAGHSNGFPTAVPEPSAWAMMLVGFGGLGIAMRSRRQVALAAVPARANRRRG
jgi:hypothetical protein